MPDRAPYGHGTGRGIVRSTEYLLNDPAAADYFVQRFLSLRRMRMDKNEIKREFRDDEGDPYVKSRRRALHRELGQ